MTVALRSLHCETVTSASKNADSLCRPQGHARSTSRKEKHFKSSSAVAISKRPYHSQQQSASRRLGMLRNAYARRGVLPAPPQPEVIAEVNHVSLVGAKRRFVALETPFNDESDNSSDDMSASSSVDSDSSSLRSSSLRSSSPRLKYVQFSSHCAVVEIPHFEDYSLEQKAAMWNGSKKIRNMARINTTEYQYDGWSLEMAAEEDQFVLVAGVPVHPAHLKKESLKRSSSDSEKL